MCVYAETARLKGVVRCRCGEYLLRGVCVCVCVCVYIHMFVHTDIHIVCVCARARALMYVCTHTHTQLIQYSLVLKNVH